MSSLLPVPDESAYALMLALHRRLRAGDSPASALAGARAEVAGPGPDPLSGFLCLGAG